MRISVRQQLGRATPGAVTESSPRRWSRPRPGGHAGPAPARWGDIDDQGVGFHPPREPLLQLFLPPELVYQIAVVVQHGPIADQVLRARGGVKFPGDLRVQDPELGFERSCFVHREGRPPDHLRHKLHVVVGLHQKGADFVGERGLADAVRTNQGKFQGLGHLEA